MTAADRDPAGARLSEALTAAQRRYRRHLGGPLAPLLPELPPTVIDAFADSLTRILRDLVADTTRDRQETRP